MKTSRRSFLAASAAATASLATSTSRSAEQKVSKADLDKILDQPVLTTSFLDRPVIVESVELLKSGRNYLVRTRSTDGVEAITVPHPAKMAQTFPIFIKDIAPVVLKRDARDVQALHWDIYRHGSNYKLQGIALWPGVMAIEQALLELMGQTAKRPIADFFGGKRKTEIAIYYASGVRGNKPEEEITYLQKLVGDSGAKAIKFRLGGMMNKNLDSLPGRTEALIPLVRKTFGDSFTLYADSNSSYDAKEAIRIGRIMEANGYAFYEEPCEFDDLWSTKEVADALTIPIALGEQEYSMHRWQYCIAQRACDIVQPDLHYGGGFIRATQVARMAAAAGLPVIPHMSGGGLGYLDVVHFASFTPNIGPYMEFKGNTDLPVHCPTSSLKPENGIVRCPDGPGFGVTIDPDFVKSCERVKLS